MYSRRQATPKIFRVLQKTVMITALGLICLTIHSIHCMTNGVDVHHGQYNYVVSIQRLDTHWCSGTIIDANHILTAAHVVFGIPSCELTVVAGVVLAMNPTFTSFPVKEIYIYPYFRRANASVEKTDEYWEDDIAVLKLTESLVWTPFIAQVPLTTTEFDDYPCLDCRVISWHYPLQDRKDVVSLKWDYVEVVMDEDCQQFNVQVLGNQKCFRDFFGINLISSEDIGSPIVCADLVVGFIVKGGSHAVLETPSTFMTTLHYSKFITDIINDGQSDVQPGEFPFVASIWSLNAYICGGVIIDDTHIVTAGFCVSARSSDEVWFIVGKTQVVVAEAMIHWNSIDRIHIHPRYHTTPPSHLENYNIYHNVALLKLKERVTWSPIIKKLEWGSTDKFPTGGVCQVLNWKQEYDNSGREIRKLTRSPAILLGKPSNEFLKLKLLGLQFLAISPYAMPIATSTDIGNPIICGDSPFGIIILALSSARPGNLPTIFLKIRPYAESGFFNST